MLKWVTKTRRDSLEELTAVFNQAHEGDDDSKEKVFTFLRSRLLVLARFRVPDTAEDVVQDALLVIHKRFREFDGFEGLLAFTNQVLRNKIGNIYQERSRRKQVGLEDVHGGYQISHDLEAGELDRIMLESINKLGRTNPSCQTILSCLYCGLDPDEISNSLGITKSKLKGRTFRCRQALRDVLSREYRLQL